MINGLTIEKIKNLERKESIRVSYEDYFDRSTLERESFSADFDLEAYFLGMRELQQEGSCSIKGQYGTISIEGRNLVCLTMNSHNNSISIPINLKDLSLK